MTSITNTLFPFLINLQTTRLETQGQHHWVMHWNQTQQSQFSIWIVNTQRNNTQMASINNQLIFPFSFNQQTTILETQVQHQWVMHWNQTQHLRNSIWCVNIKETTQNMWFINNSLFIRSHQNNSQQHRRKRSNIIELCIEIKHNSHWTRSELWTPKHTHKWNTPTIHSFRYHQFNREQHWRNRSNIIVWCVEIKHNTHTTWSDGWRQHRHKWHPSTIHSFLISIKWTGNNIR